MNTDRRFLSITLLLVVSLSSMATESGEYKSYTVQSPDQPRVMLEEIEGAIGESEGVRAQIEEYGYYPTYSENAAELIGFKNTKAIAISAQESDPYFKNLRMSPSEFPLSFPYEGITSVDKKHVLGYAPSGSFEEGHWTGVTAYFNDDHLGTCRCVVFDMPTLNGHAIYDAGYTTYDINGKPTTRHAEGSDASGYVYFTSWTGKRYEKMLECANKKPFDKQVLDDLVAYAKKIDNDLPDTP